MSTVDAYKNAITVLDPAPDSPERTGRALSLIVNGVEFEMTPRASRLSMQELPNGDYVLRLHRSETPALLMSISTNLLDFALTLDQDKTLARLEEFLGFPLAKIDVRPESVGRWKMDDGVHDFDFLHEDMRELGYL